MPHQNTIFWLFLATGDAMKWSFTTELFSHHHPFNFVVNFDNHNVFWVQISLWQLWRMKLFSLSSLLGKQLFFLNLFLHMNNFVLSCHKLCLIKHCFYHRLWQHFPCTISLLSSVLAFSYDLYSSWERGWSRCEYTASGSDPGRPCSFYVMAWTTFSQMRNGIHVWHETMCGVVSSHIPNFGVLGSGLLGYGS